MRVDRIIKKNLPAIAAAALLTGCSSFGKQWKTAAKQPPPANDISGAWEGRWISEKNGHNGRLRCVITPAGANRYDARFHAKYRKVLSFSYTVPLSVERRDGEFAFSGEANLGKLAGGVYTYDGEATPAKFFSTYHSRYDHGKFEMSRPHP